MPPTLHLTLASTCGHPLDHPAPSGTTLDFDLPSFHHTALDFAIPYCSNCLATQTIKREYEEAEAAHLALRSSDTVSYEANVASRNRYRKAKVAWLRDLEDQARLRRSEGERRKARRGRDVVADGGEFDGEGEEGLMTPSATEVSPLSDLDLGSPVAGSQQDGEGGGERVGLRRKKSVRFDDATIHPHRPEMMYRQNSMFMRGGEEYQPGRWADQSGDGFENTSDPDGEGGGNGTEEAGGAIPAQRLGEVANGAGDGDEEYEKVGDWDEHDDKMMEMTDEELEAYEEAVKARTAFLAGEVDVSEEEE